MRRKASTPSSAPITSIKGYVQFLLKTATSTDPPLLTNSLASIDKQVSKLTRLISDLLDLTKVDSKDFTLNKEVFNINELVKEAVAEVQNTSLAHTLIIHQKGEYFVEADKTRIFQAITNYLSNAVKYSPKADKVIINIYSSGRNVVVSVQDFGIGIAKKDQAKIFERFYRVHGKDENTFPGFGIGLFIVREIINRHNGKTWLESEKNKSTTFYFSLPRHLQKIK